MWLPDPVTVVGDVFPSVSSPHTLRWTEAISNATKAYDDGDEWGALAQFVLAAEQGSEAAAANAAWMLRRGPAGAGAGFPVGPAARLELAARLYERAAAQGRCAACAVELGNLVHDAEVLGLSRPRNLTEVSCRPLGELSGATVSDSRCLWMGARVPP